MLTIKHIKLSQFIETKIIREHGRSIINGALLLNKKNVKGTVVFSFNPVKIIQMKVIHLVLWVPHIRSSGVLCQKSRCVHTKEPVLNMQQAHHPHSSGSIPERNVFKRALDRSDSEQADISIVFPEAYKAHCWAHYSTHRQGKMADCKWM